MFGAGRSAQHRGWNANYPGSASTYLMVFGTVLSRVGTRSIGREHAMARLTELFADPRDMLTGYARSKYGGWQPVHSLVPLPWYTPVTMPINSPGQTAHPFWYWLSFRVYGI